MWNSNMVQDTFYGLYKSGWRPFMGWVGGFAMAYQFVIYPILTWVWVVLQAGMIIPAELEVPPILDTSALWVILTGMLGIGGMRSLDKYTGKQSDKLG